jgi:hypothetical protein
MDIPTWVAIVMFTAGPVAYDQYRFEPTESRCEATLGEMSAHWRKSGYAIKRAVCLPKNMVDRAATGPSKSTSR